MANRNVTLSMPEELVRRVRVYAVEHDTSMSELVRRLLSETVDAAPATSGRYRHRAADLGLRVDVADVGEVLDRLDHEVADET